LALKRQKITLYPFCIIMELIVKIPADLEEKSKNSQKKSCCVHDPQKP